METKRYRYSYLPMAYSLAKITFCSFLFYQVTVNIASSTNWIYVGCGTLILVSWFTYMFIKAGIPFLKGKVAIELDREKIQYFVKGWMQLQYTREIIYWKDIQTIEYSSLPRVGPLITFRITDGGNDASIYPNYIACNTDELYRIILEYFETSKSSMHIARQTN